MAEAVGAEVEDRGRVVGVVAMPAWSMHHPMSSSPASPRARLRGVRGAASCGRLFRAADDDAVSMGSGTSDDGGS